MCYNLIVVKKLKEKKDMIMKKENLKIDNDVDDKKLFKKIIDLCLWYQIEDSHRWLDIINLQIKNCQMQLHFFEEIFSKYKNYIILDKDKFKVKSTLEGKLYINNSFSYPLTDSEYSLISTKMEFNNKKKGTVGEVLVYLDDSLIHKENIYLEVTRDGFFSKIRSFFRNLLD